MLLFTACVFDPKATGPASGSNSQTGDSSTAGTEASTSGSGSGGPSAGASGQAGPDSGSGAMSGGGSGTGGIIVAGSGGGASGADGGEPPPPPKLVNGATCTEDALCESGHCDEICCAKGFDCCQKAADCPTQAGGLGMSCDDRSNCNGTAGTITCTPEFTCKTDDGAPNDLACNTSVEANDCGPYRSVFCTGAEVQDHAPACPVSCASDNDCDANAHCDGECVMDQPVGQKCDEPSDCAGNTCGANGVCCNVGQILLGFDCCSSPTECPAKYTWTPRCDTPGTCQGTSGTAACAANLCTSITNQDDSACGARTDCGNYTPVECTQGTRNQPVRGCQRSCQADGNCNRDIAWCSNNSCVPKLADGQACTADQQCVTNCGRPGICCNGDECCITDNDCSKQDPVCGTECQGTRAEVRCVSNICVRRGARVEDDSSCAGERASCGNFRDVTCTDMPVQSCPTSCTADAACDMGSTCQSGTCAPAVMPPPDAGVPSGPAD